MLKPEDAEKVLTKDLANVIRKVHSSKPLTAAERALIAQVGAGAPLVGDASSAFAKTYDELAQRLGLTRKTLQNAGKRHPEDVPRPRADGRHDVAAWSRFILKHNIARTAEGAETAATEEGQAQPVTVTDWKARELELKCEKLSLDNARAAGELVAAHDVEAGLSSLLAAARQAMNNLPGRAAQKVLHLTDFHEAEELLQGEVDLVLRVLERCEFLDQVGVNATVETASPVILASEQAQDLLPDQTPAAVGLEKGSPRAGSAKASTLPPKGKPRGKAKAKASPGPISNTAPAGNVRTESGGAVKPSKARRSARVKRRAKDT